MAAHEETNETLCLIIPRSRLSQNPLKTAMLVPALAVFFVVVGLSPTALWLLDTGPSSLSMVAPNIAGTLLLLHVSACCYLLLDCKSRRT